MAQPPTPIDPSTTDKTAERRDAEQQMLMREVDEAVRQDQAKSFARRYGWPIGGAVVLGLAALGGFMWWQESQENALEAQSETLVQAMDELDAGNVATAEEELAALSAGTDGAAAAAAMLRAGIAIQQDRTADAVALFDKVANNAELPQELRDIAAIRSVSAQYDDLDPQAVIDRLGPLAQADSAYFGSAGELVAHAYLAQDKPEQAGPLLVAIAQNEDVPQPIRGRTRQLAGLLGFDAIEDVDAALAEITGEEPQEAEVELAE